MNVMAFALALQLVAGEPDSPAAPRQAPEAPGLPVFVQVTSIDGLPADSTVRGQFMSGFRGAFADDETPAERRASDGTWEKSAPVSNRFKWLEGDASEDAWTLQVLIGAPPAVVLPQRANERGRRVLESHRRSRGMIVAFVMRPPVTGGVTPPEVRERLAFAFPGAAGGTDEAPGMPAVGYLFPWVDAGRVVAVLALETLHRHRDEIGADERLSIAPAIRTDAGR